MPTDKEQVVTKIKEIALENGLDADKAIAMAEKCYDNIPAWQPYGGATSFDQIDQQRAVREFSYAIDEQTNELRGIINNITDSNDFSVDEKASAISAAADQYKSRVGDIPVPSAEDVQADPDAGEKSLVQRFGEGLKRTFTAAQRKKLASAGAAMPDGSFPIENEQDLRNALHDIGRSKNPAAARAHIKKRARALGLTKILGDSFKEDIGTGFKVFQDNKGDYRWLSFSSNAFEDNQKELFTTAALEEAVAHADKTGDRGPLLYFHVKSAEIGKCDFQGIQGRFLIESGTFNNTPIGQKALEYLLTTDQEQQVSIGYKYVLGDENDGQYDWLRFNERSVLPAGLAANPYTQFLVMGEEEKMNPIKEASLKEVFGEDMTKEIISTADNKTKELEESGVRHKEADLQSVAFGEITGERRKEAEPVTKTVEHEHGDIIHTHVVESGKSHVHDEGVAFKAAMMSKNSKMDKEDMMDQGADEDTEDSKKGKKEDTAILDAIKDLGAKISKMDDEIKEIKKSDDERIKDMVAPREHRSDSERPSESTSTEITEDELNFLPEGVRESLKEVFSAGAKSNPAAVWAGDLLTGKVNQDN